MQVQVGCGIPHFIHDSGASWPCKLQHSLPPQNWPATAVQPQTGQPQPSTPTAAPGPRSSHGSQPPTGIVGAGDEVEEEAAGNDVPLTARGPQVGQDDVAAARAGETMGSAEPR